jgi:NAD(P)H dehydrogenase (quinone)
MENKRNPTVLILGASGTIGSQPFKDLKKPVNIRITSRKQNEVEQLCSEGKDCKPVSIYLLRTFNSDAML